MPRGGARNRSGPPVDPDSARSEKRGIVLTALPADGYHGTPPPFPLPEPLPRERVVWGIVWTSPQGNAWADMPWLWREIGLWVRFSVRTEDHRCPASVLDSVHRYADRIGLSEGGMREKGWKVAPTVPAPVPDEPSTSGTKARSRLAVVKSA